MEQYTGDGWGDGIGKGRSGASNDGLGEGCGNGQLDGRGKGSLMIRKHGCLAISAKPSCTA